MYKYQIKRRQGTHTHVVMRKSSHLVHIGKAVSSIYTLHQMSSFNEATLSGDNKELVALANRKRLLLPSSPSQSFFRVYCILVVQVDEEVIFVEGLMHF